MSQSSRIALLIVLLISGLALPATTPAQEKTFNLSHEETRDLQTAEELLLEEVFVPRIKAGEMECSISLGQLNLATTLLSHDQIIYKYTKENRWWGDTRLEGKSAFNPVARLNYNLMSWLALEGMFSISVSEYTQTVTNTHMRANEDPNATIIDDPETGEFDVENRSVMTMSTGANLIIYPFNLNDDGGGRFHPFLTGGLTYHHINMNSDYLDYPSKTVGFNTGVGLRLIADELISVRFDINYQHIPLDFQPARYFRELEDGTLNIRVADFTLQQDSLGDDFIAENVLTKFANETLSTFSYGIGFVASF